ncbi:Shikimate dehydrogenase [Symmachiella dynata]|uniref:shikimate dehydrogenase n=1 Tax=Symmachiella dynata TaxID=2527995 RepID=UPI001189E6FB|nr:shikimate dehydrogenase [Symmachiella dynata]QDT47060.1 Shikimate dehydrogenase [Symmachiella dynata]
MICVSIGRTRHKMMQAEYRALAERGAELVELRLDWLGRLPDLSRLLKDRPCPVVITCRRSEDQGRWRGTEEQRRTILRNAIADGVDYVDLEEDIAGSIPRYGSTKRIVSHHDFEETPQDLWEIHRRLCSHDPDVVKLVTMANSQQDNIRMLQVVQAAKVPTIGFCMGELGLTSRILTGKYGAPFTYATFNSGRAMAPGQLSFSDMKKVYHYDEIDEATEVYGVLGDPIAHSLSPLIHNKAFRAAGLNKAYLPFHVLPSVFKQTLEDFQWLDVKGYSVTLPHKVAAIDVSDACEQSVEEIGAANTLYQDPESGWVAANTDYDAALTTICLGLDSKFDPATDSYEKLISGRRVLILGAGGVARAIAAGLSEAKADVTITNRTHQRAIELAAEFGCREVQWENRGSGFIDILVNCTSVGMHPNVDQTPFQQSWLRDGMLVFDTIYTPERTMLIKEAREHLCKTVTGVEMFVRQAAAQYERFTETAAPLELMRETLRHKISPAQYDGA